MKVLHSEATQAVAPSETEGATDLAGAVRFGDADRSGAVFYQAFSLDELDRYLGSDEEYILATYEEDIVATLERRYPCDDVTCSRVLRRRSWGYREEGSSWPRWNTHTVSGWAVFDKPVNKSDLPEDWVHSSKLAGGCIYVLEELCTDTLDRVGLTQSLWHNGVWRTNYNPRAIELRPHRAAQKEYKRRMEGHVPSTIMNDLMRKVTRFGHDSPLQGVAQHLDMCNGRGWGRSYLEFEEKAVLNAVTVMSKLGRKFWREKDQWGDPFVAAAEFVHGIEAFVAAGQEKCRQERMESYLEYLRIIQDPEQRAYHFARQRKKRPLKFREWHRNLTAEKNRRLRLRFCQWIRSEMRARGEKMPAKPVKPTLKKKRRKKKKRSSRGTVKKKKSSVRASTLLSRKTVKTRKTRKA
jgi:hypothetical protein